MRELVPLLRKLVEAGAKENGRVFRIDRCSKAIEEYKAQMLGVLCSRHRPFVHYDEPPEDFQELSAAIEVTPSTWRLPLKAPGVVVHAWLSMGNWLLYIAEAPVSSVPDLCRAKDAEVERFLIDHEASVVIDSFHDDVSWVVGIAE